MKRVLFKTLALALASGSLTACIPMPHNEPVIPPLTGRVTRSGAPVAGAGVLVGPGYVSCNGTHRIAVTDADGRFSFAGESEFKFFGVLASSQRVVDGTICIDQGGRAWVGTRFFGGRPVECDLDKVKPNEVPGICMEK